MTVINLPEKFDITQIESMRSELQHAADLSDTSIEINAAAVTSLDSSAVQLLLSFMKAMENLQKAVKIVDISEEFDTSAEMLGVKQYLVSN